MRERLRDGDARLPDGLRDLLVRVVVALLEGPVAVGLLEGRQVLPLEVLDESDLEKLAVADVHLDARNLRESRLDRGAEAALPGDDREASVLAGPDENRLEHALGGDRRRQLREVAQERPGLVGIRLDEMDRDPPSDGDLVGADELVDEVRVVTHPRRFGESSSPRHGRGSPLSGCSTPRRPWISVRNVKIDSRYAGDSSSRIDFEIVVLKSFPLKTVSICFWMSRPESRPLVVERDDDAEDLEVRVGAALDLLDRLEQVVRSLEREVRRLDRDEDVGRRDEGVDGDHAQRRGRVDEDRVVGGRRSVPVLQLVLEPEEPVDLPDQLRLDLRDGDPRRGDVRDR